MKIIPLTKFYPMKLIILEFHVEIFLSQINISRLRFSNSIIPTVMNSICSNRSTRVQKRYPIKILLAPNCRGVKKLLGVTPYFYTPLPSVIPIFFGFVYAPSRRIWRNYLVCTIAYILRSTRHSERLDRNDFLRCPRTVKHSEKLSSCVLSISWNMSSNKTWQEVI